MTAQARCICECVTHASACGFLAFQNCHAHLIEQFFLMIFVPIFDIFVLYASIYAEMLTYIHGVYAA